MVVTCHPLFHNDGLANLLANGFSFTCFLCFLKSSPLWFNQTSLERFTRFRVGSSRYRDEKPEDVLIVFKYLL